jgi:hypothetical protein
MVKAVSFKRLFELGNAWVLGMFSGDGSSRLLSSMNNIGLVTGPSLLFDVMVFLLV